MGTIERGETNLSFKNLAKLSAALGITLSQLLSGVEKRANELASGTQGMKVGPSKR
jgi:transcriptional regulator with XRE-family HTH domain